MYLTSLGSSSDEEPFVWLILDIMWQEISLIGQSLSFIGEAFRKETQEMINIKEDFPNIGPGSNKDPTNTQGHVPSSIPTCFRTCWGLNPDHYLILVWSSEYLSFFFLFSFSSSILHGMEE